MSTQQTEGLLEGVEYGRGFFETVVGAAPAAGGHFDLPQTFQYITVPLFITAHFAADANAANRQIVVQYLDGNGNVYSQDGAPAVVIANGSTDVFWSHSRTTSYAVTNGGQYAELAHDYVRPGYTIRIAATNVQVGDQLSGIVLGVDRLPTGPRGYELGRVDYSAGRRALALRRPRV